MSGGESSTKQTMNDQSSSAAHGLGLFYTLKPFRGNKTEVESVNVTEFIHSIGKSKRRKMLQRRKFLMGLVALFLGSIACRTLPIGDQPEVVVTEVLDSAHSPLPTTTLIPEINVPTSTSAPLRLEMLQNALYRSPDWGEYQLVGGIYYRTPTAPGESAEIYKTQLDERFVTGDLNADGAEDAVAFLRTQNGGTGHFVELAAMLNQDGNPYNISTVYLGDRVIVESVQIVDGVIILAMRVQGPNDGMCCPSQLETWQFRLENNVLVRLP